LKMHGMRSRGVSKKVTGDATAVGTAKAPKAEGLVVCITSHSRPQSEAGLKASSNCLNPCNVLLAPFRVLACLFLVEDASYEYLIRSAVSVKLYVLVTLCRYVQTTRNNWKMNWSASLIRIRLSPHTLVYWTASPTWCLSVGHHHSHQSHHSAPFVSAITAGDSWVLRVTLVFRWIRERSEQPSFQHSRSCAAH
jgi:hypothetical protein